MKLGGNLPPGHDALLFSRQGIFYMLRRRDTAGHTKVFDYTVVGHSGESQGGRLT